jgi:aryl-alcohol dehydrogenase-like predicted oxidoreductase/predicted acetyltransferase
VIAPLGAADHDRVRAFHDLYLAELAAAGGDYRRDAGGRWQPDHLPYWLAEGDDRQAYLIRDGERPVGFAFVLHAGSPWATPGMDHCLAEMFVHPDARGRGVGAAAARALFDRLPGRWEIQQLAGNPRAIAFWRRVAGEVTGGAFEEVATPAGPAQRFATPAVAPSRVGLGAGRIGGPATTDADVDRLLGAAIDAGVTLIDTARSYGLSEERLGRALRGRRSRVILSTKVGYGTPGIPDWTGPCVEAGIDAALARLETDRLDLCHLHSCGLEILERGEAVAALGRAVAAGKVRLAAYSGEGQELLWAVRSGAFGAVQCSVSLVDQDVVDGAVAEARAHGLVVLAKRPLGNAPWRFAERPAEPDVAEAWDRFRALGLDARGVPWPELFTRFAAFAPGVDAILVGTASPAHLRAAVDAVARGPLDEDQLASLRAAWARAGAGWRGRI